MPNNNFDFAGGEYLTKIGASWFISYMYYINKDRTHLNWKSISTVPTRVSYCNRYSRFHKIWIQEIINMDPKNLSRNKIGLSGIEVIKMAEKLLNNSNSTLPPINASPIKIHITYNRDITVSKFSSVVNLIDSSLNDYYEVIGLSENLKKEYSPKISNVSNGSIEIELVIAIIGLATVAIELIAKCIEFQIEKHKSQAKTSVQNIKDDKLELFIKNTEISRK